MRALLPLAVLLSLLIPAAAHARSSAAAHARSSAAAHARSSAAARPAAAIFSGSRRVPPTPAIWVAARGEPAPRITRRGRPVSFTLVPEELHLTGGDGLHWAEVIVELTAGTFTVSVGAEAATFTIDPALAPRDGADDALADADDVTFERIGIERGDTLTIDAATSPSTVLYFLNHDAASGQPRYVWLGPGRPRGGSRRFELPLALLGMSCSASRKITLSLYSSGLRTSTLYPLSELNIDRGRVKLPIQSFAMDEEQQPWQACPGASVRVELPPEEPAPAAPTAPALTAGRAAWAPWPWGPYLRLQEAAPASGAEATSRSPWWCAALAGCAALCAALACRPPAPHSP